MKTLQVRRLVVALARCLGWAAGGPRTPYRKRADVDRALRHVPSLQLLEKRQAPTAVRGTDLLAAALAPPPATPPGENSSVPAAVLDRMELAHAGDVSSRSGTSVGELLHQLAHQQAGLDGGTARHDVGTDQSGPPRFSDGGDAGHALSYNYLQGLTSAADLLVDPLAGGGSTPHSRVPQASAAASGTTSGNSAGPAPLNLGAAAAGYTPHAAGTPGGQQPPILGPNAWGNPGSSAMPATTSATQTTLTVFQDPQGGASWAILTATVTTKVSTATAPAGTVSFHGDGKWLGEATLQNGPHGDQASFFVASTAGIASFAASYGGDRTYAASAGYLLLPSVSASTSTSNQSIASGATSTGSSGRMFKPLDDLAAVTTTTSLIAMPADVTVGQGGVTLTATVLSSGEAALPTGYVSFYADGTYLGQVEMGEVVSGEYVATYVDSSLAAGAHDFTASYAGSGADYLGSSATTSDVVGAVTTSTSLTATPGTLAVGQPVTLTATVLSSDAAALPAGSVTFHADGAYLGAASLNPIVGGEYVATYVDSSGLAAGSHSFSASYSGSSTNYLGSSASAADVVAAVSTSISLTATPGTVSATQGVTLTATVMASGAAALPAGYVTFYADGSNVGFGYLNQVVGGEYVATVVATPLDAGSHSFSVSYNGSSTNYLGSSATAAEVVGSVTTSTSLTATPGTVVMGQGVTLTATVFSSGAMALPAGYVTFYADGSNVGFGYLNQVVGGEYVATVVASPLDAGSHSFSVHYTGSSTNYLGSSATATGMVAAVTTSAALTASSNPITAGQAVTLSALVVTSGDAALPATSYASFYVDGSYAGVVALTEVAGDQYEATAVETGLTAGSHTYKVTYAGSGTNYLASSATNSAVTLPGAAGTVTTTTALTASPSPLSIGQAVTLTATVTTSGGVNLPGSSVETFYVNGTSVGTAALTSVAAGTYQADYVYPNLGYNAGTQSFTASYSATGTYLGSSAQATDFVNSISTSSALSASPDPISLGAGVTLTATVYVSEGGLPDGSQESFYADGNYLGSTSLTQVGSGEYEAVYVEPMTVGGTATFTAAYAPGSYSGAVSGSSATASAVVNSISTSSTLSASPDPISLGEAVTLTATVYLSGGNALANGSSESFYDNGSLMGSTSLTQVVAGEYEAVYVEPTVDAGSQSFTATYAAGVGNPNYSSSSATASAVVNSVSTSSSLSATPDPVTLGEPVTLTATVYLSGGNTLPAGSLETFYANGSSLGTTALTEVASGEYEAVYVDNFLSAGSLTFTATYAGSGSNYSGSSANAGALAVYAVTSTTSVSPSPATYGQSVTLTAVLNPSSTAALTGTESFYVNDTLLGTATVGSVTGQYQASLVTTALPTGSDVVSAVFTGNSTYAATTSTATESVNP